MKNISFEEWQEVYSDSELDIRLDPQEPEGYGLYIKGTEDYIIFPRGTLREVAQADRDTGRRILENLTQHTLGRGILVDSPLNYDSIIAAATKAYLKEEERYKRYLIEEKPDF